MIRRARKRAWPWLALQMLCALQMIVPALSASAAALPAPAPALAPAQNAALQIRRYSLRALDKEGAVRLVPTDGPPSMNFGLRLGESPLRALLRVRLRFSPALIPGQSHLRILLNGETVGVLPMTRENTGRPGQAELALDPSLIQPYNKLSFEFIGHYTDECEDPLQTNLWLDLLRGTELEVQTQARELPNDLALLPRPFADDRDDARLELPFAFAARPSRGTLEAAAIAASWFGRLADWRRARFPVQLNALPQRHALVFATNEERPDFLAGASPFAGPTVKLMDNPAVPHAKLLLIAGRDANELKAAARALVLGSVAMSGPQVRIENLNLPRARKPYDAPNWIPVERPVKFGELVASPQQLQVYGHVPEPVEVNLRIPPDLFTWRSNGVPVELRLRYTAPIRTIDSSVAMLINGEQVNSMSLSASGRGAESARVVLPLLDGGLLGEGKEFLIPAFKLGTRNRLEYKFNFSYLSAGSCRDVQVENIRAMIDPDSTIDFSGFPHYTEMPHLGYFATSGFPFTRMADLSETVVLLPERPGKYEIQTLLGLMARMGESSGYPALSVSIAHPGEESRTPQKDFLVIGSHARLPLPAAWRARLPAVIAGPQQRVLKPGRSENWFTRMLPGLLLEDRPAPGQKHLRNQGPLAALLAFESPLMEKRSVVVVTAVEDEELDLVLNTLDNDQVTKTMFGSVVLMQGASTESMFAGKTYEIGSLPVWSMIWFPLSSHPVLLALMAVAAVLVFAFALWRTLRAVAARRLRSASERGSE